jgi:hypothetical protein
MGQAALSTRRGVNMVYCNGVRLGTAKPKSPFFRRSAAAVLGFGLDLFEAGGDLEFRSVDRG